MRIFQNPLLFKMYRKLCLDLTTSFRRTNVRLHLVEFSRHTALAFVPSGSTNCYIANSDFTMLRRPVAQVCLCRFKRDNDTNVFTWFMVGMVMAPTYILLCLGSICLCANLEFFTQTFALVMVVSSH